MNITYATLLPHEIEAPERFQRPPLAGGYLAAFVDARRPGMDRHDVVPPGELGGLADGAAVAERLLRQDPRVVALSVYVWNASEVRDAARRIKAEQPETVVVVGGPEVAYTPHDAFGRIAADYVCTGEGELPFLALVEALARGGARPASAPGMVSRHEPGVAARGQLVTTLDDIPSPYLSGFLDIEAGGWVDLETTRGCPFQCRFCLYGKTFSSLRHFSLGRVREDVAHAVGRGASNIYLMDPTFNFPPERCLRICEALSELNPRGEVTFSTEARAEIVDEAMADAFARAGIRFVEVGLQATDPETLKLMRRGLATGRFVRGCRLLRERGIQVDIGVIVGLPGDDAESLRRTVDFVVSQELGHLSAYRLQVLPGSPYYGMAAQLGLEHDAEAPYYVRRTPTLDEGEVVRLEAELRALAGEANASYLSKLALKADKHPLKKSGAGEEAHGLGSKLGKAAQKFAKVMKEVDGAAPLRGVAYAAKAAKMAKAVKTVKPA